MLTFAVLHAQILQSVAPHVLLVQAPGTLPDARVHSLNRVTNVWEMMSQALSRLQDWLLIFSFCRPYLNGLEQQKSAYNIICLIAHKTFPKLANMLVEILCKQTYHGFNVCLDPPEPLEGHVWVHRACQCTFLKAPPLPAGPLPQGLTEHPRRPGRPHLQRVRFSRWARQISVPHWVAGNALQHPRDIRDPHRTPRVTHQEVRKDVMAQPAKTKTCTVSIKVCEVDLQIQKALASSVNYLTGMASEMRDYITGDVGVSRDLARRWALYAVCYDFCHLLQAPLTTAAEAAFSELYELARPELQHSHMPPPTWKPPAVLPSTPPLELYRVFVHRLRTCWGQELSQWKSAGMSDRAWVHQKAAMVYPVMALPGRRLPIGVLIRIAQFGVMLPIRVLSQNMRYVSNLEGIRFNATRSCRGSLRSGFYPTGVLVSVAVGSKQCLAIVESPVVEPNTTNIATSIESDRCFTDGVWAVARHWHRERRRGITTAAAESWCGTLGHLWDPIQGSLSGVFIDRLTLSANGFKGNGLDEAVVRAVCNALKANPLMSKRWRPHCGASKCRSPIEALRRRLGQIPHGWLHSALGGTCVASCRFGRQSVSAWLQLAQQSRATYDRADLSHTCPGFDGVSQSNLAETEFTGAFNVTPGTSQV